MGARGLSSVIVRGIWATSLWSGADFTHPTNAPKDRLRPTKADKGRQRLTKADKGTTKVDKGTTKANKGRQRHDKGRQGNRYTSDRSATPHNRTRFNHALRQPSPVFSVPLSGCYYGCNHPYSLHHHRRTHLDPYEKVGFRWQSSVFYQPR